MAMPDKQLQVAAYAAGASLAAITLVYVFAPTFFIDGEHSMSSSSTRKRGIVGLTNPANDCFINSILQSLAGLGQLRMFLNRETRRRKQEGVTLGMLLQKDTLGKSIQELRKESIEYGAVTFALKGMLDNLNERPIYKKTISAGAFLASLEQAFRQRISHQQQDAQEFFQIVAERLSEEYAMSRKRKAHGAKFGELDEKSISSGSNSDLANGQAQGTVSDTALIESELPPEEGFPLEGKLEAEIVCSHCQFKPKPSISTFVTLTLNVPQTTSTTLAACFDSQFKTEHIDDFKCEACRLRHALQQYEAKLARAGSADTKAALQDSIEKLRHALETDPEKPPTDVTLPPIESAPKRRIARTVRMLEFPNVVAIHLSRSIYVAGSYSTKNSAKVSFPEKLPLGGLGNRKNYKLLGVVTHKGSHNSGHYESFRRQNVYAPFSTPNAMRLGSSPSAASTPPMAPIAENLPFVDTPSSDRSATPLSELTKSPTPASARTSASTVASGAVQEPNTSLKALQPGQRPVSSPSTQAATSTALDGAPSTQPLKRPVSLQATRATTIQLAAPESQSSLARLHRRKKEPKGSDRWWRISDEKVKEINTSELLGFQKEVYMLFYELDMGSSKL